MFHQREKFLPGVRGGLRGEKGKSDGSKVNHRRISGGAPASTPAVKRSFVRLSRKGAGARKKFGRVGNPSNTSNSWRDAGRIPPGKEPR